MAAARYYAFFFIVIASTLAGCNNDDEDQPKFGEGSGIKGKINVQNEFQQPLYEERDGINVLFEVGFREFEVTANNTGKWQLAGAPVGTYTITYSKAGYSTIVQDNIALSYTNPNYQIDNLFQQLPTVTITKLPLTDFQDFELDLNSTELGDDTIYSLDLTATMQPAPPPTGQAKGYRIFIGEDENVSPENYIYQEYFSTTDANISQTFDNDWFTSLGLSSGDALFAAIYGDVSFNMERENEDGSLSFPNLSETQGGLASVVLP